MTRRNAWGPSLVNGHFEIVTTDGEAVKETCQFWMPQELPWS